jgi:hypothetical protein
MAQPLGRIRGEVIDVVEAVSVEQPRHERSVGDRALDETGTLRHLVAEAAGEVIEDHDFLAQPQAVLGNMRPDEPRAAGD